MGSWCSLLGSYGNGFDSTKLPGLAWCPWRGSLLSLFPRSLVLDQDGRVNAQRVRQALEIGQVNRVGLPGLKTRYGGLGYPGAPSKLGLGPPLRIPEFLEAQINGRH